jgi:CDP-diacylglycerol--glycerol-3-phosphate 3-phosphatidyltransferase
VISDQIARFYLYPRDAVTHALIRLGVRPNHMSILGLLLTIGAGLGLAFGRACWPAWVVGLLVGAGACDLLDGALAKLGGMETRFGAALDSICDRVGDGALYLGAAFYFIRLPDDPATAGARPNLTLALLACVGLVWAYLISYIKARAETAGGRGGGGFWQRPERVVTIILGAGFGHVATALWILALWPLTTVAHRLWRAARTCAAADRAAGASAGAPEAAAGPSDDDPRGFLGLVLWRWHRGTLAFDIHAGAVIAMVVFWHIPETDLVRDLLARWVGA